MGYADYARCEALCLNEQENGCCYLKTGIGCYWKPEGYSIDSTIYDKGISVTCKKGKPRNRDNLSNHKFTIITLNQLSIEILFLFSYSSLNTQHQTSPPYLPNHQSK